MIYISKYLVVGIILILVVGVGGWFMMQNSGSSTSENNMEMPAGSMMPMAPHNMDMASDSGMMEEGVKEFTVTGTNFKFDMSEIRVKQGDTVKINFKNAQGHHDFVIDEFNVKTAQTNSPSEESVTFVADKTGTFEFYCSVLGHKQLGMKGNLIVE